MMRSESWPRFGESLGLMAFRCKAWWRSLPAEPARDRPKGRFFTFEQRCLANAAFSARSLTVTGASRTSYPAAIAVPAAAVTAPAAAVKAAAAVSIEK